MGEYCDALSEALSDFAPVWQKPADDLSRQRLIQQPHGDMPRWQAAIEALPDVAASVNADQSCVTLTTAASLDVDIGVAAPLRQLMPWRKGPFDFFGVHIDTEWRSDLKWNRIAPHISDLGGRTVLDVGCGSGYHCWRMAAAGAHAVLGIDPTLLYLFQYLAVRRYTAQLPVWFAPVRMEEMPAGASSFDTVFSMGVLYHRRSPLDHLLELFAALKPGGELVLETLIVDGDVRTVLMPEDRYASMRNVYFLPSVAMLERWLLRCGFIDVRVIDVSTTTADEQRATNWMTFQSLSDFLSDDNPQLTIEGYPAPCRAALIARRPLR
ncbi:tRNA 5-methoxyuridine(34)/uridine 5-oxyacetic acid(34) synthase CmoB [Alcanivorax sp. 1008]|nr:tRNA 5-methoxyuridine(34)/uridine 5-oxyacetic acid(34) synthase CmoB [Alcanivorax sp. 1008]